MKVADSPLYRKGKRRAAVGVCCCMWEGARRVCVREGARRVCGARRVRGGRREKQRSLPLSAMHMNSPCLRPPACICTSRRLRSRRLDLLCDLGCIGECDFCCLLLHVKVRGGGAGNAEDRQACKGGNRHIEARIVIFVVLFWAFRCQDGHRLGRRRRPTVAVG